ncbi:dUTP diphosphatase [Candidatus Woesearchaeota archaeon]|nr:dUTP diphosphatase [Candidatus Woesearchaeota archaeon]
MKIKIQKLYDDVKVPHYAHPGDAGMDLYSRDLRTLEQGEPHLFKLGFKLELPEGFVAFIKDKSGLALKGLHTMGGVIEHTYRGEYGVILNNVTSKEIKIEPGHKIAQLVILPIATADIEEGKLSETKRGEGGFGSTGR